VVGGEEVIKIDVRVIAATNKALLREIQAGRFREDLYYRLNVVTLHVPPLRERREDIPLIAQHFLTLFAEKNHKNIKGFTPRAMDRLLKYNWPGNVRELMNAVERGVVLSRAEYLDEEEFSLVLQDQPRSAEPPVLHITAPSLDAVEKETILRALETSAGNKSEAARRLGITRRTLHLKLKKYGMM
jgi:two-component system response regulator HydG